MAMVEDIQVAIRSLLGFLHTMSPAEQALEL
jgi:hypothetical protein